MTSRRQTGKTLPKTRLRRQARRNKTKQIPPRHATQPKPDNSRLLLAQYLQDTLTKGTQCSFNLSDSDDESMPNDLDNNYQDPDYIPPGSDNDDDNPSQVRESKPKSKKPRGIRNYNPCANEESKEEKEINYGNLPLIDMWVAKARGLRQYEVERIAGFHAKDEEESGVGHVHMLCDGRAGVYVQTEVDKEEMARAAEMPLPDE